MKVKPKEIQAVNFGLHVKLNDQQKGTQITGVYPSPSIPDLEELVNKVVGFLNEVLGTKYQAVRVYTLDEADMVHKCGECDELLQVVRPGKYQCLNCEEKESERNDQQTARVAVEAD